MGPLFFQFHFTVLGMHLSRSFDWKEFVASGTVDRRGGVALFAVGGTLVLWAYFYGSSNLSGDNSLIQWAEVYLVAFVGLYLLGSGLWTIVHRAPLQQS
jgi:hypothetical protein